MTDDKLREILQSDKSLSLNEAKEIIYELKNDCIQYNEDTYKAGFYNGELNAFYICLDLLEKVDSSSIGVNREGTQPYIYVYPFSPKLPSHPGCHITLS